jgi:hypothetical protein
MEAAANARLSVIAGTAADLIAQLAQLNALRDTVRKAELSVRASRRTNLEKDHAFRKRGRLHFRIGLGYSRVGVSSYPSACFSKDNAEVKKEES